MSSPAQKSSAEGGGTQPREVLPVSVLTESELGSEAQRERRKRILDATMAIASKGGYEAVQMRAVADRADVAGERCTATSPRRCICWCRRSAANSNASTPRRTVRR